MIIDTLKRYLSYIPGVKVSRGYSVTTDDGIRISKELATKPIAIPNSKYSIKYKLADDVGSFELDSQLRDPSGKTKYRIRHIETGMLIVLPDNVFTLLFKSIQRDGNE